MVVSFYNLFGRNTFEVNIKSEVFAVACMRPRLSSSFAMYGKKCIRMHALGKHVHLSSPYFNGS